MLKVCHIKYLFAFLILILSVEGESKAQIQQPDSAKLRWKLIEVSDPTTTAKIQFWGVTEGATNINWDFGDGNSSSEISPTHTYNITTKDSFVVVLSYTNINDSIFTKRVKANSAFFIMKQDPELRSATFRNILRSAFLFPENNTTLLGKMRFEWTINDVIIDTAEFPNSSFGHFPNIYYTFEHGGINKVSLKAWNTDDPTKTKTLTRYFDITPNFGSTKEKFTNIPNVITPNGDGIHDEFVVPSSGTTRLKLYIYSRGGSLVYQQESNTIIWNGKNQNGKELPEGIYYYVIEDLEGFYENAKGFFYIFRGK